MCIRDRDRPVGSDPDMIENESSSPSIEGEIENGSYLDRVYVCLLYTSQGGWIQDSSSNVTYDGEWLFDGSDIPLKHGQGVLYLSDGRSVQTELNRDLPDLEKSTVFTTEKPGTKLRRSRYVGGILLEIFESLLPPDLCYHGQGIFYYEDDSFLSLIHI